MQQSHHTETQQIYTSCWLLQRPMIFNSFTHPLKFWMVIRFVEPLLLMQTDIWKRHESEHHILLLFLLTSTKNIRGNNHSTQTHTYANNKPVQGNTYTIARLQQQHYHLQAPHKNNRCEIPGKWTEVEYRQEEGPNKNNTNAWHKSFPQIFDMRWHTCMYSYRKNHFGSMHTVHCE